VWFFVIIGPRFVLFSMCEPDIYGGSGNSFLLFVLLACSDDFKSSTLQTFFLFAAVAFAGAPFPFLSPSPPDIVNHTFRYPALAGTVLSSLIRKTGIF
jgi:hypothetical protein